ncbi:MAG: M48 metallopeptidase family protein [Actinomycetota bacterium]
MAGPGRTRDEVSPHPLSTDADLAIRAAHLAHRYLGGQAVARSVKWVTNQHTRWGSCTPAARRIRISVRMREMPVWVLDYVLLHELAHLIEPGHNPSFWALLASYPKTERARGYLEGVASMTHRRVRSRT